jgi:hypothetical protein
MLEYYPIISYDSHLFELNARLSFSEGKRNCFAHYLNFMLNSEKNMSDSLDQRE